jgi:hypothetical protein
VIVARTAVLGIVLACAARAQQSSWERLSGLEAGQRVEVTTSAGAVKGEFVRADAQGITVREKKGERSLAQADVMKVTLPRRSRGIWIGLAIGAAGGLAAGAALGTRLENESGGDFSNLKPAVIGGCAAAGALIGAGIGAAVRRPNIIYRK